MKPELQFSIICDDIRQEKNGKFIFLGVFNTIAVPKFPIVHPLFHIANQWCAGSGKFKQKTRIVNEDNRMIAESSEVEFPLKDFTASHFVVTRFQRLKFDRAGKYSVEVMLDGELFRRYPICVIQIKRKSSQ